MPSNKIHSAASNGMYPCFGANGARGYVENYSHDGIFPIIGRQGALCGNVSLAKGKFYATEHAVVVTPSCCVDITWLYYELQGLKLNQYAAGAAQPGLAVGNIGNIYLLLPPLNEQRRIATTLTSIDSLLNGIKMQLDIN